MFFRNVSITPSQNAFVPYLTLFIDHFTNFEKLKQAKSALNMRHFFQISILLQMTWKPSLLK